MRVQSQGFTLQMIFDHSLKIAQAFRWVQFQRIFKYHEWYKFLIAQAFIRSVIYCMTEKIMTEYKFICTAAQIKG